MASLAVTTFNLRVDTVNDGDNRWDMRKHLALQTIRTLDPDILGGQEPRPSQVQFLDQNLTDYVRIGGGREDGKEQGEFTPLYLRKSRFTLVESGQFWLSATPDVPGSLGWDAAYRRNTGWARAVDNVTGRRLVILNNHWDNKGQQARLESARLLGRWMAENAANDPIVFTGDLNAHDDNPAIQLLLDPAARPQLFNAYRTCHPTRQKDEATLHHYLGTTEGSPIDFICHTSHFRATAAAIIRTSYDGKLPSDHYPLSAVLEWK